MIAILLPLMMIVMRPAATSAQDLQADCEEGVRGIFTRYGDDSTRLRMLKNAIDTVTSMEAGKALSLSFINMTTADGPPKNLAHAYLYAGFFTGNNGEINDGLDLTFKSLEITDSLLMTAPKDSMSLYNLKATTLMNISTFLSGVNDFDGSFQYIQQAQEVAEKKNNYAALIDIYYNIAISYIEQELYESAIQYFNKDIEASLKTGHTNTMEQELTIQSLRIKNAIKLHDTTAVLQLIAQSNLDKGEIAKIENANGISNYCISLISSNIEAIDLDPKNKRQYLAQCNEYLRILRNTIDTANAVLIEKMAYNPYYACYLAVDGQPDKAWQILKDTANFIGQDDYEMALYEYYKAKKDFKNAYRTFWRTYSGNYKKHSLEIAIHYEKSESRTNYERRINALHKKADERDQNFEEKKQLNGVVRQGSAVLLVIGAAIIIGCLYNLRLRARHNLQLRQSTEEVMMANEELNLQHEEILCQTDEIQHQSATIKAQRDELSSSNEHLMQSINVARDMQRAVMVSSEKLNEVVGENFIYWNPLNIVSGDFYWCAKTGSLSYLAVADCTGHGVPGALLSMYCISMLNDIVRRNSNANAAGILDALKETFVRSFAFDEEQYFLDGMDVAFVILDRDDMTIDYAGAKRPLIIVRDGTLQEYKPDKMSIGHNPMRIAEKFTDHKIPLQKGDMVYAFSDGISDQFGHEDGVTKFGSRQLQNILTEMSFFDLPAQKKIIESSVDNWRFGAFLAGLTEIKAPQLDDQLLIGIRI